MKSSNGSSGLTVVRFSCKIPIFFSLSHPDGLRTKGEDRLHAGRKMRGVKNLVANDPISL